MPEEEVRKVEISYPQAFCRAAKAAGARVCGVMTAAGADPESGMKFAKIIGEKEKAVESVNFDFLGIYRPAVILGNTNTPRALTSQGFALISLRDMGVEEVRSQKPEWRRRRRRGVG